MNKNFSLISCPTLLSAAVLQTTLGHLVVDPEAFPQDGFPVPQKSSPGNHIRRHDAKMKVSINEGGTNKPASQPASQSPPPCKSPPWRLLPVWHFRRSVPLGHNLKLLLAVDILTKACFIASIGIYVPDNIIQGEVEEKGKGDHSGKENKGAWINSVLLLRASPFQPFCCLLLQPVLLIIVLQNCPQLTLGPPSLTAFVRRPAGKVWRPLTKQFNQGVAHSHNCCGFRAERRRRRPNKQTRPSQLRTCRSQR